MPKQPPLVLLFPALVAAAFLLTPVHAITPTQTATAEVRARVEAVARLKAANDAKMRADALTRGKAATLAQSKAIAIGRLAVHNETKQRLEATRAAAAVRARVGAAQPTTANRELVRYPSKPRPGGKVLRAAASTATVEPKR